MNFTSKSLDTCDNSSMMRVPNGKDRKGSKNIWNNDGQNFPNLIKKYIYTHTHIWEWVASSFSNGSFLPREWTHISYIHLHWQVGSLQLAPPQFISVTQSCPTIVHYQLLEIAQTHVYQVGDGIQPSHPLSSPSPPAFNLSQHQGFFFFQ